MTILEVANALDDYATDNGVDLLDVAMIAATCADRNHAQPRALVEVELLETYGVRSENIGLEAWGKVADLLTQWAALEPNRGVQE